MQNAFELLRTGRDRARKGRIEYLVHLAAKTVDRVRDKAACLIDSCEWSDRGLIELLKLLDDLVDLA